MRLVRVAAMLLVALAAAAFVRALVALGAADDLTAAYAVAVGALALGAVRRLLDAPSPRMPRGAVVRRPGAA